MDVKGLMDIGGLDESGMTDFNGPFPPLQCLQAQHTALVPNTLLGGQLSC